VIMAVTEVQEQVQAEVLRVLSSISDRMALAAKTGVAFGGARDYYSILGYQRKIEFEDYYGKYDRQDIAGRIVESPALTTWRKPPLVYETEDTENLTPFEEAWNKLLKRHRIWHYFQRVDILAGIGRYGVLLIGFRDGDLASPVKPGQFKGVDDLLYLAVYHEGSAKIERFVTDPTNPRFGLPEYYKIDLSGSLKRQANSGAGDLAAGSQLVHWTRVIHVAEGLEEDEVFGRPRLRRVYNLLDDLQKVVGASAEMFWQGAYRGPVVSTKDDFTIDKTNADQIAQEIEEYVHGLRRIMRLHGLEAQFPPGNVPDPSRIFDVIMTLIASVTGIPKRILMGSERGELASTQDEDNWLGRIAERQVQFAEPVILRQFIDRLIWAGVLPQVQDEERGYQVEWPSLFVLSEKEQAEINRIKAETARVLAPDGRVELLIPRQEARKVFLDLDAVPVGGLPENKVLQLNEWELESRLGIISRREMLRQRGFSEDEIDRILLEVEEDRDIQGFGIRRLENLLNPPSGEFGQETGDESQEESENPETEKTEEESVEQ